MTNYIRRLLFANSISFVNLIVLIAVTTQFKFWIALPMYLFWCWVGEPLTARAVGASPADLAAQAEAAEKAKSNNN